MIKQAVKVAKEMNFNDKKTRRIVSIIVIVVVVAMVATTIIPALMF